MNGQVTVDNYYFGNNLTITIFKRIQFPYCY